MPDEHQPVIKLDPERVPDSLRHLIPYAERWGITDHDLLLALLHEAELEEVQQLFEAVHPLSHEIHRCLRTEVLGQPGSAEATAFGSLLMAHGGAMAVLDEVLWANEPQDDSTPASERDDTEADCAVMTGEEWLKAIGWPENHPVIQLDPDRIPPELQALIPYAEKWGIEDDVIRETVIEEADLAELEELVTVLQQVGIEQVRRRVLKMTVPEPISEEAGVFLAMLMAYDSARIVLSDPEVHGSDREE